MSQPDGLPAVLAARARSASDGRLVLDVAVGVLGALGIAAWHPAAWLIPFDVAICLALFGVWGIAEREITERTNTSRTVERALRLVQVFTVVAGAIAMAVAGFALLSLVLGTWIS